MKLQETAALHRTPAAFDEISAAMCIHNGRAVGHYKDMRLDSTFQPIYSVAHRRVVGHEGLLRGVSADGSALAPLDVLGSAANDYQAVFLDRLCRTLHLHNYQDVLKHNLWLFLNVSAQVVNRRRDHEPFFADLMTHYAVPPGKIVIEIVEGVIPDHALLVEMVEFYRGTGCVVAIDDFGAEASDIERIWRASPDIVKLDRKIIVAAEFDHKARRVLQATVTLIHEAGSLALLEGVENDDQALIALESGTDLLQGYRFARPDAAPLLAGDGDIGALTQMATAMSRRNRKQPLQPYLEEFKLALQYLACGMPLASAAATLIAMDKAELCYVVAADGYQQGESLRKPMGTGTTRFLPLEDAAGAYWAHKPYHYRALLQPGEIQISRPYLSVTSASFCITLSRTFELNGRRQVFCCDVAWQDWP